MRRGASHTVLASGPPLRASARVAENPSASAAPTESPCGFPDARGTLMRHTDFCLLTFFVRAPAPRRFPVALWTLARPLPIGEIACLTPVRFASVGRTLCMGSPRRALSSLRDACGPYLWHPCRFSWTSVTARARDRRDRPRPDRVNDASRTAIRDALPSNKNLCPATPFRAPGSGFPRLHGLATATPSLVHLCSPRETLRTLEDRTPVHASRCQRDALL